MARRSDRDESEEITGIDLRGLDLSQIDDLPEEEDGLGWKQWLLLAGILTLGASVLLLPQTQFYQLYGKSNLVFFGLCAVATLVGIFGGRWLWTWAEAAAKRHALERLQQPRPAKSAAPPQPPSALKRWLMLLGAVGGATTIVIAAPQGGYLRGNGNYAPAWFLAALGAVVVGILFGRWLIVHSDRPGQAVAAPRPKVTLPPWFKWVTLAVLLVLAGVTVFGTTIIPAANRETLGFALGAVGLVVGVFGAIWLARRFDEEEEKLKKKAREKLRLR